MNMFVLGLGNFVRYFLYKLDSSGLLYVTLNRLYCNIVGSVFSYFDPGT